MNAARPRLIVAAIVTAALCMAALSHQTQAAPGVGTKPPLPDVVVPAQSYRDCQRIKRCASRRCVAQWRCRECDYKRVCRQGRCEWIDVCVWGPYRLVLPPGALPG